MDFNEFSTERGYDRVWIHDGDNVESPVLIGLDGLRTPPPGKIFSSQRNMFVSFVSDKANNETGFSATYTSIDPSEFAASARG